MEILTYHYGGKVSQIISKGQELAGQWNPSLKKLFLDPPPSHAVIKIKQRYFEADWGEKIIPLFPFWRKKGGVREISKYDLLSRQGIHLRWRVSATSKQRKEALSIIEELIEKKTKYDFKGLLGAIKNVLSDIFNREREEREELKDFHNKDNFFCSELVSFVLQKVGIKGKFKPHHTTPSLLPFSFQTEFLEEL